ncbi:MULTISPECIES: DNA-binding protein [Flavobacterium]|uniref:DNA-binding protein n=1 Tax=Flavobacterium algoritolerans TaxID=3041254 RepID=A0ABT6VC12_9FLAO|nr:DNA-binding protein [Flavobacterium algoritolerans]MDI5895355.1 DNA-binding protein [Flavobacterium algoritolerans]
MENPFEIILEKLNNIEKAIEKLNIPTKNDDEILLSRVETCELLKINFSSLWKHTKSCKLTSYGIGNRVYYKKGEVLRSIKKLN